MLRNLRNNIQPIYDKFYQSDGNHCQEWSFDTHAHTHTDIARKGTRLSAAMESFWKEAQNAISCMIAKMPPLSSFSVKSGDRTLEIWLEIKLETESVRGLTLIRPGGGEHICHTLFQCNI